MIINSLLDTDLYKLTMMQVVLHQFPGAMVEYKFKCRRPNVDLRPYKAEIEQEISYLCSLAFNKDELDYLRQYPFFKSDFIEFLRIFKLSADFILIENNDEFELTIKGPWLHTIMFEVPLLAIISEVYFRNTVPHVNFTEGKKRLSEKISHVKRQSTLGDFKFSDFGTRRRFSHEWQKTVVETLGRELGEQMVGTSNVYFAKTFAMKSIGTMAHEYIQACQSLGPRLLYSQKFAFEKWAQEYRGDLGIALSDTYGTDAFIRDFDLFFCKLFDGARQDSGDPFVWGEKIIEHYKKMRVDPKTKTLVFSDSLTFEKAIAIHNRFKERANPVFGIGTNLTNDLGYQPIDIVIKMVECNGQPVAKVSEEPGKTMCKDESYLRYLKKVFQLS